LATLHQQSAENFGLSKDNYIGSLKQINTPKSNWTDFFIENRLQEQLKMAVDSKLVDGALLKKFDQLFKQMPNYFPEEKPSRRSLVGELYGGS
jgi:fructosamine-3-kinase